ncbi:sulfatase [Thalassotalea nanhaiensis]|uniref:Sulfatase n=1 Tax=Thalassotalea nanhaiensis TaxID=3065648 RepID=A0ABY9TL70_9GAMM|nr:sulfatase [Colwelliaceae bacterium SQ345]
MKRIILALLIISFTSLATDKQATEKLNVLFIGADDLRMNLGAYGDNIAITPNIDALATQGVVFTKAHVQFTSCNASRASMLTGMRPDSIKVYKLNTHFRSTVPDIVTLPQHFKNNGYHTESIGKIYHNYANITDEKSWSVPARLAQEPHFNDYVLKSSFKSGKAKGIAAESATYSGDKYVDDKITSDAVQTITRLKNTNKPFFLGVGFMKPHSPYNAPKKFWDLYQREDIESLGPVTKPDSADNLNWFKFKEIRGFSDLPNKGNFAEETAQRLRHGYYAATSYVDDNIGRLIKALKDNGLYENTVIVFWSDHGYHLGENNHWTKVTVRELDTRVPLIFRIPGQKPFKTNAITEYIDIYPTLADICNLPSPKNLDGSSFNKLFSDPFSAHKKAAFSQVSRPWPGNKPITHMGYTVRTDVYRYTRWIETKSQRMISEELYHTENDVLERQNLINSASSQSVEELRKLMDAKLKK